jgi:ribonuclease BN (tRNA processing enzyme)
MPLLRPIYFLVLLLLIALPASAAPCPKQGIGVQVLGSGGTRIDDNRASSGFLVRHNGRAIIMVNVGGGAAFRFAQSGAQISDLKAILITNVQADSTAALPALVQMSINKHRESPLQLYGPGGYKAVPSTVALIRALFEVSGGAYRELGTVLSPLGTGGFKLRPRNIDIHFKDGKPLFDKNQTQTTVLHQGSLRLSAAPIDRSGIPALAWRVDIDGKSVVFAGMPMGKTDHLLQLAQRADALVIAVPQSNNKSISLENIARLAKISGVRKLILTNLSAKTDVSENSIKQRVGHIYKGEILFAKDLDCVPL